MLIEEDRGVVGRELPVVEREEVREEIEMAYLSSGSSVGRRRMKTE
jgi:hypothetical protein